MLEVAEGTVNSFDMQVPDSVMSFVQKMNFVYPLMFESEDTDFPVFCGGTCFVVRLKGKLYLVTARHCLSHTSAKPILMGPDHTLSPLEQHVFIPPHEGDSAWTDVAFVTMHEAAYMARILALTMPSIWTRFCCSHCRSTSGHPLAVKGYPASLTEVGDPMITRKATLHLGLYGGPTDDKHCHFFHVLHPKIKDPNSLSGSPVLAFQSIGGAQAFPTLLGMLIQGGLNLDFFRFVGSDVIAAHLLSLANRTASDKNENACPG